MLSHFNSRMLIIQCKLLFINRICYWGVAGRFVVAFMAVSLIFSGFLFGQSPNALRLDNPSVATNGIPYTAMPLFQGAMGLFITGNQKT